MRRKVVYRLEEECLAYRFHESRAKVQIFGGGFANGKTAAICIKALRVGESYPGANILMSRATYPKLNDTLRKEFIKWCPTEWIKRRPTKDDNTLVLTNGTMYNFRYIQQQGKNQEQTTSNLLSATYDAIFVDQMEDPEITHKDFLDLLGRLRGMAVYIGEDPTMPRTGPRIFCITCNPTGNWVYRKLVRPVHRYYKGLMDKDLLLDKHTQEPLIEIYEGSTYENEANLEPDFIDTLETTYKGQMKQRFLLGKWASFEGLVYGDFTDDVHVIKHHILEDYYWSLVEGGYDVSIIEGYDHGLAVPSCYLLGFVDYFGNVFLLAGYYEAEKGVEWLADEIKDRRLQYQVPLGTKIHADPAIFRRSGTEKRTVGKSTAKLFADEGIQMVRGNNDIINGIQKVQGYVAPQRFHRHPLDGTYPSPFLFVSDELEFVANEMNEYYWRRDTSSELVDMPQDRNDHAMDTLKYMLSTRPPVSTLSPSAQVLKGLVKPTYMTWQEGEDDAIDPRVRRHGGQT